MDAEKFATTCQKARCTILKKVPTKHGNVLLAERIVLDKSDGTKVWETLWAIERDGTDVAQVVRNPVHEEINGIWRSTDTPEDRNNRVKEAVGLAIQFIEDNRAVGRYT